MDIEIVDLPEGFRFQDLRGKQFGKLKILGYAGRKTENRAHWWIECDCGTVKVSSGKDISSGKIVSCGCVKNSGDSRRTHGLSTSPLYRRHYDIVRRCLTDKHASSHNYKGRGIDVYQPWIDDVGRFINDVENIIGPLPFEGAEIDRIDNDRGYYPDNIRWVDHRENSLNRRNSHGHSGRDGDSPTYISWENMNQIHKDNIDSSWCGENGFKNFLKDMGEKPEGAWLKRYDETLPCGPENSYWKVFNNK